MAFPDFLAKVFGRSSEVAEVAGKAAGKGARAETAASRMAEEVRMLNAQNAWPIEAIEKQYGKFSPIAKRAREANPEELKHIQRMLHGGDAKLLKSDPAEFERLLNEKIGGKGGRSLTPTAEPTPVGLPNGGKGGMTTNPTTTQPHPELPAPRPAGGASGGMTTNPSPYPELPAPRPSPTVRGGMTKPERQLPAVIPKHELATIPDQVRSSASTPLEIVDELGHPVPQERGLVRGQNGPTIDIPNTYNSGSSSRFNNTGWKAALGIGAGAGLGYLAKDWMTNGTGWTPNLFNLGRAPTAPTGPAVSPMSSGKNGANVPYSPQPNSAQPNSVQPSKDVPYGTNQPQYSYNNHDSMGHWISNPSDFEGLSGIAADQVRYMNKKGMASAAQQDNYIAGGLRHPDRMANEQAAPQYNAMQQAIQRLGVAKKYGQGEFQPYTPKPVVGSVTPSSKVGANVGASDVAGNVAAPTPAPSMEPKRISPIAVSVGGGIARSDSEPSKTYPKANQGHISSLMEDPSPEKIKAFNEKFGPDAHTEHLSE